MEMPCQVAAESVGEHGKTVDSSGSHAQLINDIQVTIEEKVQKIVKSESSRYTSQIKDLLERDQELAKKYDELRMKINVLIQVNAGLEAGIVQKTGKC